MRLCPVRPGLCLAASLLTSTPAGAAYYGSGWYGEVEAGAHYDDNLGRTGNPAQRREDFATVLAGGAGYEGLHGTRARLGFDTRLEWQRFSEFEDLDQVSGSVQGWYLVQPVPGFATPWFEFRARGAVLQHRDSDIRDGGALDLGARAGKRLAQSLSVGAGYTFRMQRGEGPVFDLEQHAIEGDFDWTFAPRATLHGGYSFQWGDVVSTSVRSALLQAEAEAMAADAAFGGAGSNCAVTVCAWRFDGRTHSLWGGASWEFAGGWFLDVSVRWFRTDWGTTGRYEGLGYRAGVYFRF